MPIKPSDGNAMGRWLLNLRKGVLNELTARLRCLLAGLESRPEARHAETAVGVRYRRGGVPDWNIWRTSPFTMRSW